MKLMRWMLAAAAAVAVAGTADAQRQRQQPGQGGAGRGGFGQQGLATLVVSNKDLQSELKVTDEQKTKFKDVADKTTELQKKGAELRTGQPDMDKLAEFRKEMTALTDDVKKVTDSTLTDAQKKRLKQLEIQRMGLRAFSNDEVVKELKITDDEKTKIKETVDATTKELADLRKEMGLPAQGGGRPGAGGGNGGARPAAPDQEKVAEFNKKAAPINEKAMETVVKLLTDEQQKTWKDMVGEKFDVAKLTVRPGAGRQAN